MTFLYFCLSLLKSLSQMALLFFQLDFTNGEFKNSDIINIDEMHRIADDLLTKY